LEVCCLRYLIFRADSSYGTLIKTELIPAIAYLRTTYPLSVKLFFPTTFLANFSVNPDLDCTNLMATDLFFDSIYLYKYKNSHPFFSRLIELSLVISSKYVIGVAGQLVLLSWSQPPATP
jgi:hypothetical protein